MSQAVPLDAPRRLVDVELDGATVRVLLESGFGFTESAAADPGVLG